MLPILRILPVGGVLLAILIFLLALTPPGGVRHALPDTALEARGPLIDRDSHPEWRQFLMQAALQRADELKRLRDLPDTPSMQMQRAPEAPAHTEIVIPIPAPVTRTEAPVPRTEEIPPQQPPANVTAASAPVPSEPAPEPAPTEAAPAINAAGAPRVIAALPSERGETDPEAEDVTGTINEFPGATIPIDIGETSSTELPVVLPEERPPVIRTPERAKPARDSRHKPAQRTRRAKAGPKVAPKPQPPAQLTLFEKMFGPLRAHQRPAVVETRSGTEIATPPNELSATN
jgi:hypothetical protein